MVASRHGQDTAVHMLLTMPEPASGHRADPNVQDSKGDTALHYATSYGHLKAARTLIAHGADPWIMNHFSWTAIDYSSTAQAEVYLRELVADIEDERRRIETAGLGAGAGDVGGGGGVGGVGVGGGGLSGGGGGVYEGLLGRGGVRLVPASDAGSMLSLESAGTIEAEKERGSPGRRTRPGVGSRAESYGSIPGRQMQGLTTPTRERVEGPFGSP